MLIVASFCSLLSGSAAAEDADLAITEEPLFSIDSLIGPIEYRPGRGLGFESIGLNIGGYTALEYEYERTPEEHLVELEGLNFLILWEPLDWFSSFAEFEVGPLLVWDSVTDDVRQDVHFEIDRLYGDLIAGDSLRLRFGRYQTPIGRWNMIFAEPFTWTASEPVFLERAFAEQQTGAALTGFFYPEIGTVEYWLYSQFLDPLTAHRDEEDGEFDDYTAGARLQLDGPSELWSLGTSFLASERFGEWSYLGGLDALLRWERLELTSEFEISRGDIPGRELWDIYLQSVVDVGCGFYLVARYEHFEPTGEPSVDLGDLGVAWVPVPFVRIKVDYRIPNRETDDVVEGVNASFSLVF